MSRFMIFRSLRETNYQMGISHNQPADLFSYGRRNYHRLFLLLQPHF